MPSPRPALPAPESRQLFIAHLAASIDAMETGRKALDPMAYRLFSRRLREAMAGCPAPQLAAGPAGGYRCVVDALVARHFDEFGRLPHVGGRSAQLAANRLFSRLRKKVR